MIINFHRKYDKQYKPLNIAQNEQVKYSLLTFRKDPFNPLLRNHPLKGVWAKYRTISDGGDLRLHYKVIDDNTVLFVAVGTHSQLYK